MRGRPFAKGDGRKKGRPKGAKNKATLLKEWAAKVLNDPQYRENARQRVLEGKAPMLEQLIWHHVAGKPKEVVEQHVRPLVIDTLTDADRDGHD